MQSYHWGRSSCHFIDGCPFADIEGSYFYIILGILLVWRRTDLFNVSLYITGYVGLHNQISLLITLSKLVFPSHCICFYYIMISVQCHQHTPSVSFHLHDSDTWAVDFVHVIVPVICFLPCLLNRYWFVSCQLHMCHLFCLPCIYGVLASFKQVIVPVLLYLTLFVN